jgi:hypothetical protein
MLSQRALDRRENQNIVLDSKTFNRLFLYKASESSSGITVKAKSKWLNAIHVRGNPSCDKFSKDL